jgi:hypothetical protein
LLRPRPRPRPRPRSRPRLHRPVAAPVLETESDEGLLNLRVSGHGLLDLRNCARRQTLQLCPRLRVHDAGHHRRKPPNQGRCLGAIIAAIEMNL